MSKNSDAQMLRAIGDSMPEGVETETLQRIAAQLESDAKRYDDSRKLQDIGKSAYDSIAEMVAALECDYDRLEELRVELEEAHESDNGDVPNSSAPFAEWLTYQAEHDDALSDLTALAVELKDLESAAGECKDREEAEQRIHEDPLSVQVRGDWHSIGDQDGLNAPVEFEILLGTGGPATRIMGELNEHGEPTRAWIQAQDWFQPWTDYVGGDSDTLLAYCRCFYFGEG